MAKRVNEFTTVVIGEIALHFATWLDASRRVDWTGGRFTCVHIVRHY